MTFPYILQRFIRIRTSRLFSFSQISGKDVDYLSNFYTIWASPVAQMIKNLPAMQETWLRSLGQEDPLEKGMAPHSSILAWRSHGQRSLVGYSTWHCKEPDTTE